MPWNANPTTVKDFIESCEEGLRKVDVSRTVLDPYGSVQWDVTFTQNPGETPLGAGNVDPLTVVQEVSHDDGDGVHHLSGFGFLGCFESLPFFGGWSAAAALLSNPKFSLMPQFKICIFAHHDCRL